MVNFAPKMKKKGKLLFYIAVWGIMLFAVPAFGQEVKYMLASTTHRTWIGANVLSGGVSENTVNLTFYSTFKVQAYDRASKRKRPAMRWYWLEGNNIYDRDIKIAINGREFQVEFTKTENGKDFMTLTRIPKDDEEEVVVRNYYAAD